jgi:hypothetical protein
MIPDERLEARLCEALPSPTDRGIASSGTRGALYQDGCSHVPYGWQDREVRIARWREEDIKGVLVPVRDEGTSGAVPGHGLRAIGARPRLH